MAMDEQEKHSSKGKSSQYLIYQVKALSDKCLSENG